MNERTNDGDDDDEASAFKIKEKNMRFEIWLLNWRQECIKRRENGTEEEEEEVEKGTLLSNADLQHYFLFSFASLFLFFSSFIHGAPWTVASPTPPPPSPLVARWYS